MTRFDFDLIHYGEDGAGAEVRETRKFVSEAAAKAAAGTLAKRVKGPVDIAHSGPGAWADRYMTTASPSEYHTAGYRFERIES